MIKLRLCGQRPRDADALLLTARKLGRIAVDVARAHFDLVQQFLQALAFGLARQAKVELQRPPDDRPHGLARVHRGIGHLIDHLQLAQIVLAPVLQRGGKSAPGKGDLARDWAATDR